MCFDKVGPCLCLMGWPDFVFDVSEMSDLIVQSNHLKEINGTSCALTKYDTHRAKKQRKKKGQRIHTEDINHILICRRFCVGFVSD